MTDRLELPIGTIEYEQAGRGPVVVLVHAFGPRAWGWPLTRLTRDCTVIAMGLFTASRACPPHISEMDLVQPVLQHLGCQRFTLCPWSMAGASVLEYAATQPPELAKLVLADVAGLAERPAAEFVRPQSPAEWAQRRAAGWVHQPGAVRDLVEALDLEALTRTPGAFEWLLDSNQRIHEAPPPLQLEKIAVPTLVLTGRHSLVMGPDAARRAARRLPDGQVSIFEHSAHALALEEAVHFQNVVADFVLGRSAS